MIVSAYCPVCGESREQCRVCGLTYCSDCDPHDIEECGGISEIELVNRVLSNTDMKEWDAGKSWDEETSMDEKKFDPNKVKSVYVRLNPDENPHVYDLATDERVDRYVERLIIYPNRVAEAILYRVEAQARPDGLYPIVGGTRLDIRSVPVVQFLGEWNAKGSGKLLEQARLRTTSKANPSTVSNKCTCDMDTLNLRGCQCGGK